MPTLAGPPAGALRYDVQDRVAVVTIENAPVNALSPAIWEGLAEVVARAEGDEGVDGVVLIGAGRTFVAGTDIRIFDTLTSREKSLDRSAGIHAVLQRLEDSSKPVVAAIHGHALGGGSEVALACHYRLATPDARIGQPEVLLGIIPGAGGTQRMPRLCGPALALDLCTSGRSIGAERALEIGLIDRIVTGDLREEAIAFAWAHAGMAAPRARERTDKVSDRAAGLAACADTRARLTRKSGAKAPYPALDAVVDAIQGGLEHGFDAGSRRERELFADCVLSPESRALRHLFFAEREAARLPGIPTGTPVRHIGRVAVAGAGTMGAGIAMAYASAGIPVLLREVDQAALDRGLETIRRTYESAVRKGRLAPEARDRALALITTTPSYDGFDAADIVVEAVFEDLELKTRTFAELGRVTREDCILASNSSSLDIDELGRVSGRPASVLGHHFFSPAHIMKLLEIVRGRETGADVLVTSLALAKRLGKVGVVVGNCPGFVANRMLASYRREALLLLEEGASVPQIDAALVAFGLPVGPFGMQDIAGIDVGTRVRQYLRSIGRTLAEGPQSEIPDRLCEMGRYGQKTGAGWYRYPDGSRERVPDPLIEDLAEAAASARGIRRSAIADEEIVARIMIALANEGARVLEEGYATRAGDVDIIYCHGFGFPRYRGGPLFYADTVGLPTVLARVREYREQFGDYWRPAPLLERLVAEGRGFHASAME